MFPLQRAIVFANGDLWQPDVIAGRLGPDDLLIAADGGARLCRALGRQPHLVIGDLDSLPPAERAALQAAGVRFEQHRAEKDETDLELALLAALRAGAQRVAVVGALGGRLDMTLANVLLLGHPALDGRRVELWHGPQTAWLIRPPGETIPGQAGDTLSLIPLEGAAVGVSLAGLRYPLTDDTLPAGPARGVSNVLTGPEARVSLRAGQLLAVHTPGRA